MIEKIPKCIQNCLKSILCYGELLPRHLALCSPLIKWNSGLFQQVIFKHTIIDQNTRNPVEDNSRQLRLGKARSFLETRATANDGVLSKCSLRARIAPFPHDVVRCFRPAQQATIDAHGTRTHLLHLTSCKPIGESPTPYCRKCFGSHQVLSSFLKVAGDDRAHSNLPSICRAI